jgi:hypothetical protein
VPDDQDIRDGLDAIQADMAAHQRRFSGEVTAEANRTLAASEFERLEKKWAEEAQRPQPHATEPAPRLEPPRDEHREINGAQYTVSSSPVDDVGFRAPSPAEVWFMEHAWPRVELLMTKIETGPLGEPSWQQRTMAVFAIKLQAVEARTTARNALGGGNFAAASHYAQMGADLDRRYIEEFKELLEESSRVFGDWKADAPKRIQVG